MPTRPSQTRSTPKTKPARQHRPTQPRPAISTMALQRAVAAPASARPADLLALQRNYGNQAVQRLLARHTVQAKLMVGPAGDHYEQEADRVAAQVLQPGSVQRSEEKAKTQPKPVAAITSLVQRRAEEEGVQTKRQDPRAGFEAGDDIESQLRAQQGTGSPLSSQVRAEMETRFGVDFGGVRVHTDGQAALLNQQMSAQAFTFGQDIYVGAGQYQPETEGGQHLLAHELTHVVQQTGTCGAPGGAAPQAVQRLANSHGLTTVAGRPHSDLTAFGKVVRARSAAYKKVLAALNNYHGLLNQTPTFTSSVSLTPERLNKVLGALTAVETECKTYVAGHAGDKKRTPHIQAIVDDVPAERQALKTITENPQVFREMLLSNAVSMVRYAGGVMKQAGGMLEAQSARQLKEAKATGLTGGALKTRTLEQFGAEMDLIKAGTDKVPGKTPDAFSFRGNTDASKLTSGMGIQEGLPYFQSAILPLLVPALNLDNKDAELDRIKLQQLLAPKPTGTSGSTPTTSPDKSVTEETLKRKLTENAGKVQTVYTSVMSLFTKDGAAKVPPLLAQFCAQLHTLAKSKGMAEDQAYLLISSQLFLRIIVPMITMMVSAIGENQKGKRAMTVIAKLVQNDANNARHGDKDPLLLPFASLNHQAQMQAFVQEVISKGGTL